MLVTTIFVLAALCLIVKLAEEAVAIVFTLCSLAALVAFCVAGIGVLELACFHSHAVFSWAWSTLAGMWHAVV